MVIIKIVVAVAAAAGVAGMFSPAPVTEVNLAQSSAERPAQQRPIVDFERLGHAFR